jgi:hypothetical protein
MAKFLVAAIAAVAACAATYAFAATLAPSSSGLGAGSEVVAACGSGMILSYTSTFDATASGYVVNGIDVSRIPAGCRNKSLSATFYDDSGATIGSAVGGTMTATGTTQSIVVTPSSNFIDAGRVGGVSVVVS